MHAKIECHHMSPQEERRMLMVASLVSVADNKMHSDNPDRNVPPPTRIPGRIIRDLSVRNPPTKPYSTKDSSLGSVSCLSTTAPVQES